MVHSEAKHQPVNAGDLRDVRLILGGEDPLEEGMATPSSIPACRIPTVRGAWQATGSSSLGHPAWRASRRSPGRGDG